jgi:phosphotransferase system HPr (HPr) family protein
MSQMNVKVAAITLTRLAVGATQLEVVPDEVGRTDRSSSAWSCGSHFSADHRVVGGAVTTHFLADLKSTTVTHGDRTANAKSILTVLTLGAHQGAEITIQAEGADADDALAALESLIKKNFEE